MLPGYFFFPLNASPSTENMQNANVKAVPPSSSAQAHCSTVRGGELS